MRKSKVVAAKTRERIVAVAAREFRRNGIEGTGLADLMAHAGLTHGGFYRHFESKGQLVTESFCLAMNGLLKKMNDASRNGAKQDGASIVAERYLSVTHRDHPEAGCPLAALGAELARGNDATREAAAAGFLQLANILAGDLHGKPKEPARRKALAAASLMIGALTMARVVNNRKLSAEILDEALRYLQQMAA